MPWGLTRFHHSGQSHFVTFCCYHRHPFLTTDASRRIFDSLGAGAAQFQAPRLRLRGYAGACAPAAQRTGKRYIGRCAEVAKARSSTAFDWRSPTQVKNRLEWGTPAFLAKAVLRFQHSKLPAVCGKAALRSSQSGEGWVVQTSAGLGVEQFSPLRNRVPGTGGDRVRMDGTKTRTSGGKTSSSARTAPLKPKPGLSGPPAGPFAAANRE
jgi:hypothetical protein